MPNYENETCLSCHFFYDLGSDEEDWCRHKTIIAEMARHWPALDDHCDFFVPSLECRKVRALERLAGCVKTLSVSGESFDIYDNSRSDQ